MRYQHIRADPQLTEEGYGVDARSLHGRSTHQFGLGEKWNLVAFGSVGLYGGFRGGVSWRDLQTSAGAWFDRRYAHGNLGLGLMAVQRPGTFLPLPVISFGRKGDRFKIAGVLPTNLSATYTAGPVEVGLESNMRLGTYHLTTDASPDTYAAYTTLLAGPMVRWNQGAWTVEAAASWIPYRVFRRIVDGTEDVVEPARGWSFGLRVDWKLPDGSKERDPHG